MLNVPQFSVDARVFMVISYLEILNFVLWHLSHVKSWHVKLNQIITVTFVRKLLCSSELFVFNTDTHAVTSGEYGNISESDQRDLEGLSKICHNF